jgi:hypothetical protein
MNDKIKELAKQAGFNIELIGDKFHIGFGIADEDVEPELKKFAELIVKECCNTLNDDRFGSVRGVMTSAQAVIKEHFGVE